LSRGRADLIRGPSTPARPRSMVRRLPILAAVLALAATGAATGAASAQARTGRCLPGGGGPTCHFWTGKAVSVNDGDTVDVDVDGDGSRRAFPVRFAGVQAMELTRYNSRHPSKRRGQCQAVAATNLVERLVRRSHRRVRLAAQRAGTHFGHRLGRTIAVRSGGRWIDVGERLMRAGLALWMPDLVETAWNDRYNKAGQEAAARHAGLWNPSACGSGPQQDVPLKLWASWDPPGVDSLDLNGEFIKVQNRSASAPLALGGWWLRDSMLRRFTFPAGTVVPPGATVTLRVGPGASSGLTFHWGLRETIFQNIGDGAYLFDPQGDLRASMVYPCVVACADPNQGAVALTAQPRRDESVTVRNVSAHAVDLYGYALSKKSYSYAFGPDSVLAPGEQLEVEVEGDPRDDTRLRRHWGLHAPVLRDGGDAIGLSTFSSIVLACDAWGDARCTG